MSDDLIDIIYQLLIKKKQEFKDIENANISSYYDNENMKHIKINFGYETYIVSIDGKGKGE